MTLSGHKHAWQLLPSRRHARTPRHTHTRATWHTHSEVARWLAVFTCTPFSRDKPLSHTLIDTHASTWQAMVVWHKGACTASCELYAGTSTRSHTMSEPTSAESISSLLSSLTSLLLNLFLIHRKHKRGSILFSRSSLTNNTTLATIQTRHSTSVTEGRNILSK